MNYNGIGLAQGVPQMAGANTYGGCGDNSATQRNSPVPVVGAHSFMEVSAGYNFTAGLKTNGELWAWGYNNYGQLGQRNTTNRSSPVSVVGAHAFIWVSAGYYIVGGLKSDGSAWLWGENSTNAGAIGDLSKTLRSSPVSVVGAHAFIDLAVGPGHCIAVKSNGEAWAWGKNNYGQLGNQEGDYLSGTKARSSPVSVVGAHAFVRVFTGGLAGSNGWSCSAGMKSDGSIWVWGGSWTSQVPASRSSPVSIVGAHSFKEFSMDSGICVGLKSDGSAWTWGDNGNMGTFGTLGQGSFSIAGKTSPVAVIGGHVFAHVQACGGICFGLKSNGEVWGWGSFVSGELGIGLGVVRYSSPVASIAGQSFASIACGYSKTFGLTATECWAWGENGEGMLADGSSAFASSPVSVIGAHTFSLARATTYAYGPQGGLKADGSLWLWGRNTGGQLGQNNTTTRSSPVPVIGSHVFSDFGCGKYFVIALKSNGEAWGWGGDSSSNYGAIGDGTRTNRSSPVSVVGAHSFSKISVGQLHTLAVKSGTGECWSWGSELTGLYGCLGQGTSNTSRSSPVSVVGAHSFNVICSGNACSFGIKSDTGEMWAWGYNNYGQLGQRNTTNRSSPVSVVGAHAFVKMAAQGHVIALKSDGSAWAWGYNSYGQLGDGSSTNRSSPVSVVGAHSFVDVAVHDVASFGLKADGTVWGWGDGSKGQLANGQCSYRCSPVLILGSA